MIRQNKIENRKNDFHKTGMVVINSTQVILKGNISLTTAKLALVRLGKELSAAKHGLGKKETLPPVNVYLQNVIGMDRKTISDFMSGVQKIVAFHQTKAVFIGA